MTSSNAPNIIVTGDNACGKTTFCHRMEHPSAAVRTNYGSVTRDHYSMSVEMDSTDCAGGAQSSFVLVDQRQLCSLQRMVFRRAVGLVVIVDATALYPLFLESCESPRSESRASTQSSWSHHRDSPARGSSEFFPPAGSVPWDVCLIQLVMSWKTVVQDEAELSNERGSKFKLPCIVIFSKMDQLVNEDEEFVTLFKGQCQTTCLGRDIQADMVAFVSLAKASSEEIVDLRYAVVLSVNKRLAAAASSPPNRRRQSIILTGAQPTQPDQRAKKPCCGSS